MAFTRSQLPAARRFVDSVYSAGGARVGRGSRHPSTWSDDYTLRVANVWQRQAAAGRELSLQEARRGPGFTARIRAEQEQALARGKRIPGGLEHPRQRFVGPTDERGRPDLDESVGFYARQYRSRTGARRWVGKLSTDRVQVIAYGSLTEGYAGAAPPSWRILYTGPRDEVPWDALFAGYATRDGSARVNAFDTIERWEVRWGPGIGD